ncbi:MAG: signaling recognition particle receptor family protein [Planctomycetota bacterium]|nr:signaling recognition particle receptor family protein [Planctomycetota bacterium]
MGLFKSVLSKIKQGLEKTREVFVGGLRSMLTGRRLDEDLLAELHTRLLESDVGRQGADRLIDAIRAEHRSGKLKDGDQVLEFLKAQIKGLWPPEDRRLTFAPSGPTVILVTGVNGAGKTTSIAKLCKLLTGEGKSVMLGACDTFRAGAVRQLEIWADRLKVPVIKGQQGGDPAAVAFDACGAAKARGVDVLILDTAGRLQTQDPLMRQLGKIKAVTGKQIPGAPHEVLLVLDATAGQNALRQAEEFDRAMGGQPAAAQAANSPTQSQPTLKKPAGNAANPTDASSIAPRAQGALTGIVLAKLDGTAKGGIVIAIRDAISVPVKFVGVGETVDDLEPFDPDRFVEAMFSAA